MLPLALASVLIASPRTACARYVQPLPTEVRAREAERITALTRAPTSPDQVHLMMGMGDWRLVWATPADSEEGIWFLKRSPQGYHLVETWGGISSSAADQAHDVTWATRLGVPGPLARCFASIELNHEMMQ